MANIKVKEAKLNAIWLAAKLSFLKSPESQTLCKQTYLKKNICIEEGYVDNLI
jgi:hypothetical protein